ncbi:UDP-N-acetylmuramoyl-L-alanyl-D-glutamate--2,6-diaminopimelate ligase [Anaerococcus sp. AGMB00486]|uniref:UDP-N-acetylmuramyl-tripeptide synthetase n=1 Tax=Anaerococcus faecalis TaxID=2742993 RepID=A0ABX2NA71_9FIRM|nr:UDP-N-acetylmuramoyl-L-alanyl-D-glutamate--2,6-diaminopimelate ligase [Anaerococcus faecalis]NVF11560.1 UDP-N-acetylmuramoyl-L-alanyl-D-glutamate--2,6-diaminopimelate ligase [Anaerococcus faecalis]
MNIEKLLEGIDYIDKNIGNDRDIEGISSNSREIKENYIFLAIKGLEFDGHKFIGSAIENGASTIVYTNKDIDFRGGINYIRVDDSRIALAQISNKLSNYPSKKLRMIGVTGTNGKTTTANMISFILTKLGDSCGNIGTDGADLIYKTIATEHTTPEITDINNILIEANKLNLKNIVMETSSHGLYLKRCFGIDYDYGVFTNLSPEHMDFHKNMENYFKAKMILIQNCKKAIINKDDDYGKKALKLVKNPISISINEESDYRALDIKKIDEGLSFKIKGINFKLKRFGIYDIYNALCAIAIASDLGYRLEDIADVLKDFKGVKSRLEFIENDLAINIVVDFAHTSTAFENIYKVLPKDKDIYAVYGISGDRTVEIREAIGEISAKYGVFSVITVDDPKFDTFENISNDIARGIKKRNGKYKIIGNRKDAIKYAIKSAKKGDFVLCLGKGEENFLKLKANIKTHYYEKDTIREVLKEI